MENCVAVVIVEGLEGEVLMSGIKGRRKKYNGETLGPSQTNGWVDGVLTDDGNSRSIPLSTNEDPSLINTVYKS